MHYFERWDAHNKAREKVRSLVCALVCQKVVVPEFVVLQVVCCNTYYPHPHGFRSCQTVHSVPSCPSFTPLSQLVSAPPPVLVPPASITPPQARKDAATFAVTQLESLSDKTKTPTSQLKFIMDAWAQVCAGGVVGGAFEGAQEARGGGVVRGGVVSFMGPACCYAACSF